VGSNPDSRIGKSRWTVAEACACYIKFNSKEIIIMKADDITFYAIKDGKPEWWFKLGWGDGHGYMRALPIGTELKRFGGVCGSDNRTGIDLADYDSIDIKINNKECEL
jgi:hypothetical protein